MKRRKIGYNSVILWRKSKSEGQRQGGRGKVWANDRGDGVHSNFFFHFFFFLSPSVSEPCLYFDSLASKLPNFAFSLLRRGILHFFGESRNLAYFSRFLFVSDCENGFAKILRGRYKEFLTLVRDKRGGYNIFLFSLSGHARVHLRAPARGDEKSLFKVGICVPHDSSFSLDGLS